METITYLFYRLSWRLFAPDGSVSEGLDVTMGETAEVAREMFEHERRKAIDAERKRTGTTGIKPKIAVVRVEPLDAWLRVARNGWQWQIDAASVNAEKIDKEIQEAGRIPATFSFEMLNEQPTYERRLFARRA